MEIPNSPHWHEYTADDGTQVVAVFPSHSQAVAMLTSEGEPVVVMTFGHIETLTAVMQVKMPYADFIAFIAQCGECIRAAGLKPPVQC
jgi:hypothetical protein